jgi:hypothetical protein
LCNTASYQSSIKLEPIINCPLVANFVTPAQSTDADPPTAISHLAATIG